MSDCGFACFAFLGLALISIVIFIAGSWEGYRTAWQPAFAAGYRQGWEAAEADVKKRQTPWRQGKHISGALMRPGRAHTGIKL